MANILDKFSSTDFLVFTLIFGTIHGIVVNLLTDKIKSNMPTKGKFSELAINTIIFIIYGSIAYTILLSIALKLWHLIDGTHYYSMPSWSYKIGPWLLFPIWIGSIGVLFIAAINSYAIRVSSFYKDYPFKGFLSTSFAFFIFSLLTYMLKVYLSEVQ